MLEPFLLHAPDKEYFRVDLNPKIDIVRKLAKEFADFYIPLDGFFASASIGHDDLHWSEDGVHPNDNGSEFIGDAYANAINILIDEMDEK